MRHIFKHKNLIYLLSITLFCCICCRPKNNQIMFTSPDQQYVVKFDEEKNPIEGSMIRLEIKKQKMQLVTVPRFSLRDDSGIDFFETHKKGEWVSKNILKINSGDSINNDFPDEILVINNSNLSLGYLMINRGRFSDKTIVLEFEPSAQVKLLLKPGYGTHWLGVTGSFSDGTALKAEGMDFDTGKNYLTPSHYCVVITSSGAVITSKEYEGIVVNGLGETRKPRSSSCQ